MARFSERQGIVAVSSALQTEGMTDDLRNSLWNVFLTYLVEKRGFMDRDYAYNPPRGPEVIGFTRTVWQDFFKLPLDRVPDHPERMVSSLRHYFFTCNWYGVYEFLEVAVSQYRRYTDFHSAINAVLERELSGFRLVEGQFIPVTNQQEVEALEEAIKDERFPGVRGHLQTALTCLADRKNPDYRNCIKESISAVESMAREVTGDPKATLGDALKVLEKQKKLHPALKEGFSKLYGYTSDEQGIRHAMLDEPAITAADAKFFLLSCTSFVNYLKSLV
jgi:hypothetical protein